MFSNFKSLGDLGLPFDLRMLKASNPKNRKPEALNPKP